MYITEKKEEDLFNHNRLTSLIVMDGGPAIHVVGDISIHVLPGRKAFVVTGIKGLISLVIMQMYNILQSLMISMVEIPERFYT